MAGVVICLNIRVVRYLRVERKSVYNICSMSWNSVVRTGRRIRCLHFCSFSPIRGFVVFYDTADSITDNILQRFVDPLPIIFLSKFSGIASCSISL